MKPKKDKAPSFGRHAEFQARKLMLRAAMWIFMSTSSYNMQSEEEVEKRTRIGPVNKLKIRPNLFPSLSFSFSFCLPELLGGGKKKNRNQRRHHGMVVSRSRSTEQGSVYALDRLVFLIHHTYRRSLSVTAVNVSTAGPFGFHLSKQKSYQS